MLELTLYNSDFPIRQRRNDALLVLRRKLMFEHQLNDNHCRRCQTKSLTVTHMQALSSCNRSHINERRFPGSIKIQRFQCAPIYFDRKFTTQFIERHFIGQGPQPSVTKYYVRIPLQQHNSLGKQIILLASTTF